LAQALVQGQTGVSSNYIRRRRRLARSHRPRSYCTVAPEVSVMAGSGSPLRNYRFGVLSEQSQLTGDLKSLSRSDYALVRDTIILSTRGFTTSTDVAAITCACSALQKAKNVWDAVQKLDDIHTGRVFKPGMKDLKQAGASQLSKNAIGEATAGRHAARKPKIYEADTSNILPASVPAQCVIWGKALSDGSSTQWNTEFCLLLLAMNQMSMKIPILCVTRGVYSRQCGEITASPLNDVFGISLWGLIRSAQQEMPQMPLLMLDVPSCETCAEIPRGLALTDQQCAYYHGNKFTPHIEAVPSLARRERQTGTSHFTKQQDGKTNKPIFKQRAFSFGRPTHKLDNCWFRQSWTTTGPARADWA